MSLNRNKEQDKAVTRQMILDPPRAPYPGGENWLGHGVRAGKHAQIDYLLLVGATMDQLRELRNTPGAVRAHFDHLKDEHDLTVKQYADGKHRFDREHLEIVELRTRSSHK